MVSRLGTGKPPTFFYSVVRIYQPDRGMPLQRSWFGHPRLYVLKFLILIFNFLIEFKVLCCLIQKKPQIPYFFRPCTGRETFFFKGLVAHFHSFYLFYINQADIQDLYILLVEYHSCFPHCIRSVEGLLWGVEPRFELGPAVQQADALLSEPRRTHYLSHAAPRDTLFRKIMSEGQK